MQLYENSEESNKNLEYKNEINEKEPTKNLEIVLTEDIVLNTSTVYDTIKKGIVLVQVVYILNVMYFIFYDKFTQFF